MLCALLAGALTVCLGTAPAAAVRFTDTTGHSAESAIDNFASLGILQGYGDGRFGPTHAITRGDMCTILSRIFTYTEQAENTFADLDESLWYARPVLQLNAAGVIRGYGDGSIRPTGTITWEEALVMIARAFGLPERTDTALPYEDRSSISDWALGGIAALYTGGYLHSSSRLNPKAPFSRADAVVVLDSLISNLGWEVAGKAVVDGVLVELPPEDDETVPEDGPIDTGSHNYPYDPSQFVAADGRIYYTGTDVTPSYGIDVSTHQGEIDWDAVAADGAEFAMIRLGFRGYGKEGTLNLDARFAENIEGAVGAGLKVGVYFFSQAISVEEAIEEAHFVLDTLRPYGHLLSFPVVYDWESMGTTTARTYNLSDDILNACALAFCGEIEAAGYQPMIYFYPRLGEEHYDLDLIDQYPFWYCDYRSTYPALERPFRIWQYTSSGRIDGIEGDVDWNICFWPY